MTTLQMSVCKAQYDIFIILRAGYPITMESFTTRQANRVNMNWINAVKELFVADFYHMWEEHGRKICSACFQ